MTRSPPRVRPVAPGLEPSAAACVEVITGSPGCTVQDAGRFGHRHQGIPLAGWLDPPLAQAANLLAGNPPDAACLELRGPGPVLRVSGGPVRVALAGRVDARLQRLNADPRPLRPWTSATLQPGDLLRVGLVAGGCAYLALHGGVQVPPLLGSRSTYVRAGLGGLHGEALRAGDRLPCTRWADRSPCERQAPTPWTLDGGPVRVLLGPQLDHFPAEQVARFLSSAWQATAAQDRMGLRLAGPLQHRDPAGADIVSDGVAPGAIQVPANGQPIVLLADGQTVGGYPKIATVITADLPKLTQAAPGTLLHFQAVDAAAAHAALVALRQRWRDWAATLCDRLPPGALDEAALYAGNLISGAIDARAAATEDSP